MAEVLFCICSQHPLFHLKLMGALRPKGALETLIRGPAGLRVSGPIRTSSS